MTSQLSSVASVFRQRLLLPPLFVMMAYTRGEGRLDNDGTGRQNEMSTGDVGHNTGTGLLKIISIICSTANKARIHSSLTLIFQNFKNSTEFAFAKTLFQLDF
jgi:hypothetical protein